MIMMMITLTPDADDDYALEIISNTKNGSGDCFTKSLRDAIWAYERKDILMLANILIYRHSRVLKVGKI